MGPGVTAIVKVRRRRRWRVRVPVSGEAVVRSDWLRAEDRREAIAGVSCLESMQSSHLALPGPRVD